MDVFAKQNSAIIHGMVETLDLLAADGSQAWQVDLGNARETLKEAMVKLYAGADVPAGMEDLPYEEKESGGAAQLQQNHEQGLSREEQRAGEQPAKRPAELLGSPVKFADIENLSLNSVFEQMVAQRNTSGLNVEWRTVDELDKAVGNGYDPGNHFSFTDHGGGAITVKLQ